MKLPAFIGRLLSTQVFDCVFRNESGHRDYWMVKNGVHCCSYCESVRPDDAIKLFESGLATDLESTSQSNKFFLHIPGKMYRLRSDHFTLEEWGRLVAEAEQRGIINVWRKRAPKIPI